MSACQSIQGPGPCVIYESTSSIGAVIMTQAGAGWKGWEGGHGDS